MVECSHFVVSSVQELECEEMVSCTPTALESCLCDTISMEEEKERGEEEEEED